jgi:hypothetical protein
MELAVFASGISPQGRKGASFREKAFPVDAFSEGTWHLCFLHFFAP